MRHWMVWCGMILMLVTLVMGGRPFVHAGDVPLASPTSSAAAPAATAPTIVAPGPHPGQPSAKIVFTNVGDAGQVEFTHFGHGNAACADCHEGVAPLFPQSRTQEGYKMADMYAGKTCGACHDGKKAFAAMGDCTKCHQPGN